MSVEMMTLVLKHAEFTGGEFITLLCLANHAWKDGTHIFPGVKSLVDDARLSERQVRRCLENLEKSGVLIKIKDPDGRKENFTSWRIDVPLLSQGTGGHGVRRKRKKKRNKQPADNLTAGHSAQKPADICDEPADICDNSPAPPNRNQPSLEPSSEPSSTGARATAAPEDENKKSDHAFERLWAEFRQVPGFSPLMRKDAALNAYRKAKNLPPTGVMIDCIRAWKRELAAENARRPKSNPHPMLHPATWLNQGGWKSFLESAAEARAKDADRTKRTQALEGDHAALAQEFGLTVYDKWFVDASIMRGPPFTITVESEFKANWIRANFAGRLRRIFKADSIAIEGREQEVKAA